MPPPPQTHQASPDPNPGSPKIGPIFICGRQHSGNTVVTQMLSQIPGCFAIRDEDVFFEYRTHFDAIKDPVKRANGIVKKLKIDNKDLVGRTAQHLTEYVQQRPDQTDSVNLYRQVIQFIVDQNNKQFLVQKATSYIFYGKKILDSIPEASIVYLIRNPYDVSASKKQRAPDEERIIGWGISWNKGIQIAQELAQAYPKRVHLLKYEDLVQDPQTTVKKIFDFIGVPYNDQFLDVPVINPSESPHIIVKDAPRRFNKSKLFHYTKQLTSSETAALDIIVSRDLIQKYYPSLPHINQSKTLATRLGASWYILTGPFWYAFDKIRLAHTYKTSLVKRTLHRLRVWLE